ncbi:MAG: hypothetical protein EOO77_43545 [Oxalobacteraceae bacterium]|nr:MAG: hypothetical protein EOO77_43545 [Oxalobacteraceae bacterium]
MTMVGFIVFLLCMGMLTTLVMAGVKAARHESRQWIERETEEYERRILERQEFEVRLAAFHEDHAVRYAGGARLNLEADGRRELYGSARSILDGLVKRHSLRKDVREWCKVNLASQWTMLPFSDHQPSDAILWFEDPNEAVWFKMQWY